MKVIVDITEEGLKYAKMLHLCGMADGFHEAIANGIPIINGTELASLLVDMRINEDIHDCTFIVPKRGDNHINEVVVKRYKAKEALQQELKSERQQDQKILKAYIDGANGVLANVRAEIEKEYNRLRATRKDETLEHGECLGLKMSLKIINKYKTESEVSE